MAISGDIVKAVLDKFPNAPTRTLAGRIYNENKNVFRDVEHVRSTIRYHRGKMGEKNKKRLIDKRYIKDDSSPYNPFNDLPEEMQDYSDYEPVILKNGKWLVIADAHIPYYRREPLEIALQYGLDEDVDGICMLGDMADFYSVSFWQKDPRRRNFQKERRAVLDVLGVIRQLFPNIPIVYKLGNHEERLERYLRVKAPELLDLELLSFEAIIEADKYNIQVVKDKRILKLGRLYLIHGHEFGVTFFSPVNPARGLYLRGKEIALCAHYHQTSQHTEKSMADVITSCWSIGGLCDLHPEYRPLNKWNYGFAIVDNTDGEFRVYNKKIIGGQVY